MSIQNERNNNQKHRSRKIIIQESVDFQIRLFIHWFIENLYFEAHSQRFTFVPFLIHVGTVVFSITVFVTYLPIKGFFAW